MEKTLLYRCPGPNRAWRGHTYESFAVSTQAEMDEKLQAGWSSSLMEAVERFDMAKKPEEEIPSNLTPAEKAEAAQKAMKDAAEKVLVAKRALEADTEKAEEDAAALAKASERADKALAAVTAAQMELDEANREKTAASRNAHLSEKTRKSSRLHLDAAESALDAAAGRVLTTDKLLKDATEKALAEAEAKEEALAEAEGKAKGKPAPKPDPKPAPAAAPDLDEWTSDEEAPTLDDVKAALAKLKTAPKVRAVLKPFGVKAAPELEESQYMAVLAAVDEALKGTK